MPAIADWLVANVPESVARLGGWPFVLDAGCGNGELLRLLIGKPFYRAGCDIEPGHVAIAKERSQCAFILPIAAEKLYGMRFDVVVAISWLHNDWQHHHAAGIPRRPEDPGVLGRTLEAFARLLPRGGWLVYDAVDSEVPFLEAGFNGFQTHPVGEFRPFKTCRKM